MDRAQPFPEPVLRELTNRAAAADQEPDWPVASLQCLQGTAVWGWSIPEQFGGSAWASVDLLRAYEELAAACLTTAFILSQRDAAIRRIVAFAPEAFDGVLRRLAAGEWSATIGLSQLTTSRQHGQPALLVTQRTQGRYELHGEIPWVTGADKTEIHVIGGKDEKGGQYLFALPSAHHPKVTIEAPMPLMALAGSRTTRIRFDHVTVGGVWTLIGPVEEIPALGRGGTGGLETSCLSLGLGRAAVAYLQVEATQRPELGPAATQLGAELDRLRTSMHGLAAGQEGDAASLRTETTQFVLTATQVALVAAKGAGYVRGHVAERWARQALFFLVWSCPRAVQQQVIEAQVRRLCQNDTL